MLLLSLAQADRILFVDRLGNMEPGCLSVRGGKGPRPTYPQRRPSSTPTPWGRGDMLPTEFVLSVAPGEHGAD